MIAGKSLIRRVWERCSEAVGVEDVYIATDSSEIARHVEDFGGRALMTSSSCRTGTDRVWDAVRGLDLTHVINVQGDEPLVSPDDIRAFVIEMELHPNEILNGMCPIQSEEEFRSGAVPKVVASLDGRLLYMSRAAIPTDKALGFKRAWKQVCIYAFPKRTLEQFAAVANKTPLETIEDIEILRFLELGIPVRMLKLKQGAIAVDVPEDVGRVEAVLRDALG